MAGELKGQPASAKVPFGDTSGVPRKHAIAHHEPGHREAAKHVPLPSDRAGKAERPAIKKGG